MLKPSQTKIGDRLYKDGEDRKLHREKLTKQKERYEAEEAVMLANINHGLKDNTEKIRTIDEFIDDQILYE